MPTLDEERESAGLQRLRTLHAEQPDEEAVDIELVVPERDAGKLEPLSPFRRLLWKITGREG